MAISILLDRELEKEEEATLRLPTMTDAEFYEFCERNPLLNVERSAKGDILLMAPADGFGDSRNAEVIVDLGSWNRILPVRGIAFGASAGFTLPNGAVRSPDAAWISASRWNAVPTHLRSPAIPFAHVAPDFVVEVMSPSDRLKKAQEKMEEYLANGVRLGWLVDRDNRTVYVYRPNVPVETLTDPATVSGDPELAGLVVDMTRVFQTTI